VGLLCKRIEFSVSVTRTRQSQDDAKTARAKPLCGYEGKLEVCS
jgi:hypothetical protein